jgi:dTDP-glucose pyrophosphorylase
MRELPMNKLSNNNIIVMAGGMSSRMKQGDDTSISPAHLVDINSIPKCMIPVGKEQKAFLYYLLTHVHKAGYTDVLIIVNSRDTTIEPYCKGLSFPDTQLSCSVQKTPPGRTKPMGTADAVLQGLLSRPDWKGRKFTVCNADNLYSPQALQTVKNHDHPCGMIAFDRQGLGIPEKRISGYGIVKKDEKGFVINLIEKPPLSEISTHHTSNSGVNMNLYHFDYDLILPFLQACPLNETRNEKELTTAVKNMVLKNPRSLYAISLSDPVLDLTFKTDISAVNERMK